MKKFHVTFHYQTTGSGALEEDYGVIAAPSGEDAKEEVARSRFPLRSRETMKQYLNASEVE